MTSMTSHAQNAPCWAGVRSPDVEASVAFYSELFGWDALPAAANGYVVMTHNGAPVVGIGPFLDPGDEARWCTYVNVADADASAAAAVEAGATIEIAPFDVMDVFKVGVVSDAVGAELWFWQPYSFIGAHLVDEPGAVCWRELATSSVADARDFYGRVFGWETDDDLVLRLGGDAVGGITETSNGAESGWTVAIGAEDVQATVEDAERLGATVVDGAARGESVVLSDPHGAVFAVTAARG